MSRYEFTLEEFETRQNRVREAMEKEGIDLLLVTAPSNIAYLIGSRAKGFQEFQCLFFTLEPGPLTVMTRLAEVAEYMDLSLAEDVRGWGGREPEDPIEVLNRVMQEKGYLNRRVGLEVPYYYLSAQDYLKIKKVLGTALVTEASTLIEKLKYAKSPAEIAYIWKASEIADAAMQTAVGSIAAAKP